MKKQAKSNGKMKELRTAWTAARRNWQRTEKSIEALVDANQVLLRRLTDAGVVVVHRASKEFATTVGKLERAGKSARRQFDRLTHHHEKLQRQQPV